MGLYTCEQKSGRWNRRCTEQATYRFLWPGFTEQKICAGHALKARALAKAQGLTVLDAEPVGLYIPGTIVYLIGIDQHSEDTRYFLAQGQALRGVRR